jgi:hypothetical protein
MNDIQMIGKEIEAEINMKEIMIDVVKMIIKIGVIVVKETDMKVNARMMKNQENLQKKSLKKMKKLDVHLSRKMRKKAKRKKNIKRKKDQEVEVDNDQEDRENEMKIVIVHIVIEILNEIKMNEIVNKDLKVMTEKKVTIKKRNKMNQNLTNH